jgi:hypothetical protein
MASFDLSNLRGLFGKPQILLWILMREKREKFGVPSCEIINFEYWRC